jgi:MoxR-like ATPase
MTAPSMSTAISNQQAVTTILARIEKVVLGKPQECRLALACLLAQGHLLIEDLPGMGKTTLAHMLATTVGLSYQRTQFTNDLLPADVVGFSMFDKQANAFKLHKGPIFNQVVLADEINRASPKTQSALLEAMAENQVSIDGITYALPDPFFVIATQNPLFHAGTYPLPESQLDRFMMRLSLGFPDIAAEKQILLSKSHKTNTTVNEVRSFTKATDDAVISHAQLLLMQAEVSEVSVSNDVVEYILALVHASRRAYMKPIQIHDESTGNPLSNDRLSNESNSDETFNCKPLSPRAAKSLLQAAKAMAFIDTRDYVLPDDVQAVFHVVCQHRLEVQPSQQLIDTVLQSSVAQQILESINVINPLNT